MKTSELELRDDVLQALYWLRREKLGEEASAAEMSVWLGAGIDEVAALLAGLERSGLVAAGRRRGAYRLSAVGREEGERRFTDAERPAAGHAGACSADCACHHEGAAACSGAPAAGGVA